MRAEDQLADLARRYHEHQMAAHPLAATYYGLDVHRDELPDLSADGQDRIREQAMALRQQVQALPTDDLDDNDRTSHAMLLDMLHTDIVRLQHGWTELAVDSFATGPQTELLFYLSRIDITDAAGAADFLARMEGTADYLDQALRRHRDGVANGRTPVQRGVTAAIAQCRSTAEQTAADALVLGPLRESAAVRGSAMDTAQRLWEDSMAPAFLAYAEGLQDQVLPVARDDDRAGLCWLVDGDEMYAAALREFTTLADPDPAVIHQTGLEVIAELEAEYAQIGGRFLGLTSLAEITERLHHDPALNYDDPGQIVNHAQELCDLAAGRVGEVIGRLPAAPCVVKAIPEVEAHGAAAAFYQVPAEGREHGTYWVNTIDPVLPRAEAEATAFHEAAPGHHTQLALQLELDLPAFRRIGNVLSGYAEGWGLYTERLADEIGLYSGDLGRLGMLATDSMRACRLVVDTGIHHKGWSRQQAIEYMSANSPLPQDSVCAEIDRYIVYPGQACSYMLGRIEIQRLRTEAEQSLGTVFDLRAFHDVVLGQGCVPLTVLAQNVNRWLVDCASDRS
ncbi:hypothetical protein BH24ACT15_BH24ACT15_19360 [soil metagenome]